MDIKWWAIEFSDGSSGFVKMFDGMCVGVYRADGSQVLPSEKVEYTCVDTNASAPLWA